MKSQIHKSLLSAFLVSVCMAVAPGYAAEVENFESLKFLDTVIPAYPLKMTWEGIYDGQARVIIEVDENGELIDIFLESYTHPEFGRIADNSIRKWTFQPAKLNGEPVTSIKPVDFNFDDRRGVFSAGVMEAAAAKLKFGRYAKSKQVYNIKDLDNGLEPIEMEQPPFPEEFRNKEVEGFATVMFYVDETGNPRMTHVTDYSHESFGRASLLAVDNWKFKPPKINGKPATILVRQTFNFVHSSKK